LATRSLTHIEIQNNESKAALARVEEQNGETRLILARIYVESDHAHTQHGHLELFYVVVYKTDKREIAGTNNSHLFAHKLFEFSHDHFNIPPHLR